MLRGRIQSWCASIEAEKALNATDWELNLAGLPSRMQLLTNRVNAVLDSTVHRLCSRIVDVGDSPAAAEPPADLDPGHQLNLQYMLSLSRDLVDRISSAMGITPDEFEERTQVSEKTLLARDIDAFSPFPSIGGGRMYRIVIGPQEQEAVIQSVLEHQRVDQKTTLLPGRRSLELRVVCEIVDLPMTQLVSTFWHPKSVTLQLAERLRTRIDIDWEPATALLEVPLGGVPIPNPNPQASAPCLPEGGAGDVTVPLSIN